MAELLFNDSNIEIKIESHHSIVHHDLLFFHSNAFINRKEHVSPVFFNLYQNGQPLASIAFEVVDRLAISLPQSPFGGFIYYEEISQKVLEIYLKAIIQYYRNKNIGVQIKMAPDSYHAFQKEVIATLEGLGFSALYMDSNQHVAIEQASFRAKINRSRSKQLDLCILQGYQFKKLNTSYLEQAYELITECLEVKNYPITMTLEELKISLNAFDNRYFIFGVFDKNDLIATAISVNVNNKILYNFYHGDRLDKRQNSPMTLLLSGIYEYCQKWQFDMLDLGISTSDGVVNEGLFYFKRSCGAISTEKRSYELKVR